MRLSKLYVIALLVASLAVIGCGDNNNDNNNTGGSGGSGGTGGTGGTGGGTGGNGGGSGGDNGGGNVMTGLYKGIMGNPFDNDGIGYAVCFYVAEDLENLMVAAPCNVENIYDNGNSNESNAFDIEVEQADCNFNIGYDAGSVAINSDGSFAVNNWDPSGGFTDLSFSGTINGNTASGTAVDNINNCTQNWSATLE